MLILAACRQCAVCAIDPATSPLAGVVRERKLFSHGVTRPTLRATNGIAQLTAHASLSPYGSVWFPESAQAQAAPTWNTDVTITATIACGVAGPYVAGPAHAHMS